MSADDRRFSVLKAIVADYVATQEPVGSKSIVDRHQLAVSSATIRNDMAVLEQDGYIAQPHTSAGRIPTDKGYRLFVDRLSQVKPLSGGERRAIEQFLSDGVDLEDVLHRSVRLLAQLTRQVAVVQYPSLSRARVRHIELVHVEATRLLIVVITDTGRVEQRIVRSDDDIAENLVPTLRGLVSARTIGKLTDDALRELESVAADISAGVDVAPSADDDGVAIAGHEALVTDVVAALRDALVDHPEERLMLSGTSNITGAWADQPATLRGVLEALDEQVTLLKLLASLEGPDVLQVSIGEENADANLSSSALVSAGYGSGEVLMGGLAVVGPTRMDYPGTMATVRAVARYIGDIVTDR